MEKGPIRVSIPTISHAGGYVWSKTFRLWGPGLTNS